MPSESAMGGSVNIEPLYDGVIMLSSDSVLFNNAKPRPDGREIYHVFEHDSQTSTISEISSSQQQLLSQASENSMGHVFQVLLKGASSVLQEWMPISELGLFLHSVVHSHNGTVALQDNSLNCDSQGTNPCSSDPPVLDSQSLLILNQQNNRTSHSSPESSSSLLHYHPSPYKIHKFHMNYPSYIQMNLAKSKLYKRLHRRCVTNVIFEPENFLITVQTKRSAHFIASILKRFDPDVNLLNTSHDFVPCEEEICLNSGTSISSNVS